MLWKFCVYLILNSILFQNGLCQSCEMDEVYLHFFGQIEHVKKSLEIMNARFDTMSDRYNNMSLNTSRCPEITEKPRKTEKPIFDIRFDSMPRHCSNHDLPNSCPKATECTKSSGIYTIRTINNKEFTAYCDYDNYEGDWLYILKRVDGTVDFNRGWSDYVNGFGDPAGEYWIGLENLYEMTNSYGPQELNVYLETFDGRTAFARYDNFAIGNAAELYKLKSLGRYTGTAGDCLYNQLDCNFSTFDKDNDKSYRNCARLRKGAFWFNNCTITNPTGPYLRGKFTDNYEGAFWKTFEGNYYSQKTIIFMIRRRSSAKL